MILQEAHSYSTLITKGSPKFADHYLFIGSKGFDFNYPSHRTALGLITMIAGQGKFLINGKTVDLDTESFVFVNEGSTLSADFPGGKNQVAMLFFNPTLAKLVAESQLFEIGPERSELDPSDFSLVEHHHFAHATLARHLALLQQLGGSCASFNALKADMLIRNILDGLIEENYEAMRTSANLQVVRRTTRIDLYQRLSQTKMWMSRHFRQTLSLEDIAKVAMMNKAHFSRSFKKAYDQTPHQYLTYLRLEEAKRLLTKTNQSITQVCLHLGFESLSSFSRLFSKRFGLAPSKLRHTEVD
ncbi:MAG: helix-turn-helix transcriptional regulator [Cyclobacteriaceae bacterium]|nr:helix-turn-helix transcriptional regulator [Cyclobacteriaceae bacterium HetDA_MAG_MS6]